MDSPSPNATSNRPSSVAHRGICPTSCSVWCATAGCSASTRRRPTPSRPVTGCSLSITRGSDVDFQLKAVPLLSRIGADRADQVRTDVDAAAAGWPEAALLRLDSRNQVMVADGKVVLGEAKDLADKPPPDAVFLGRMHDGQIGRASCRERVRVEV